MFDHLKQGQLQPVECGHTERKQRAAGKVEPSAHPQREAEGHMMTIAVRLLYMRAIWLLIDEPRGAAS
jgi:hypothetical protein